MLKGSFPSEELTEEWMQTEDQVQRVVESVLHGKRAFNVRTLPLQGILRRIISLDKYVRKPKREAEEDTEMLMTDDQAPLPPVNAPALLNQQQ